MTQLAILADDVTGAADAGAAFASVGLATSILFTGEAPADIDVLIRSTNSRDADAATAVETNTRAAHDLIHLPASHRPHWVYKKIDSALRGHPGEELLAIMTELGEVKALIAPALPAEARHTVGGKQYVGGTPLHGTSLGPSEVSSDLAVYFGSGETVPLHSLDLNTIRQGRDAIEHVLHHMTSGFIIADAETDRDLYAIAEAALTNDVRLLAGSAGLARQVARALPIHLHSASRNSNVPEWDTGPILTVAGSLHPAAAAQVETLQRAGLPTVRPVQAVLDEPSASLGPTVRELATYLAAGRSVVLTTVGRTASRRDAAFVVSRLADIVAAASSQSPIGGLVLTGGDVAAGVLSGIGARELRLVGEIRPAIPWGILHASRLPLLPVATKAGSFGGHDALLACVKFLTGMRLR